ncbi:RimK family alpha-L-glutamate ligase, partial [archaeon]|nr:RimK family alpha-L-glutamate ligase [archaeon]
MKAALISLGSTSSKWTYEAMQKYFDTVDNINLKDIEVSVGKEPKILHKGTKIKNYDCIFAKGSFRYAQILQSITNFLFDDCYMPINPESFTYVHDKLLTHLILQKHNIPMPKTYITSGIEGAKALLKNNVKFPIVMKFPKGTGGKGVMFSDSFSSASSILDALAALNQPFIIQEYIDTGGEDLRLIVAGEKIIASYTRVANIREKRANLHSGGTGVPANPDIYTKKIAIKAAKALKADLIGIDILVGPKGPLVIEANLSPGLQGVTKITNIDVADRIAKFLHKKTNERNSNPKEKSANDLLREASKENDSDNEIFSSITLRGNRILIPEIASKISGFTPDEDVIITASKGKIIIKK